MESLLHVENGDSSAVVGSHSIRRKTRSSNTWRWTAGSVLVKYGMAAAILFLLIACFRTLKDFRNVFGEEARRLAEARPECVGSKEASASAGAETPGSSAHSEEKLKHPQSPSEGRRKGGDLEVAGAAAFSEEERRLFLVELPKMRRDLERRLPRHSELGCSHEACRREIADEVCRATEVMEARNRQSLARLPFLSRELGFLAGEAAEVANLVSEELLSSSADEGASGGGPPPSVLSKLHSDAARAASAAFEKHKTQLSPEVGSWVPAEALQGLTTACTALQKAARVLAPKAPEVAGVADLVVSSVFEWIDVAKRPTQSAAERKFDTADFLLRSAASSSSERAKTLRDAGKGSSLLEASRLEEQAKALTKAANILRRARGLAVRRQPVQSAKQTLLLFREVSRVTDFTRLPEDKSEVITLQAARRVVVEIMQLLQTVVAERRSLGIKGESLEGHSSDDDEDESSICEHLTESEQETDVEEDIGEFRRQVDTQGKRKALPERRGSDNPFGAEGKREIKLVEESLKAADEEEKQRSSSGAAGVFIEYVQEEIDGASAMVEKANQDAERQKEKLKGDLLSSIEATAKRVNALIAAERALATGASLKIARELEKVSAVLAKAGSEIRLSFLTSRTTQAVLSAVEQITLSAHRSDPSLRSNAFECLNACNTLNKRVHALYRLRRTAVENDLESATILLGVVRKAMSESISSGQPEKQLFTALIGDVEQASRRINRCARSLIYKDSLAAGRELVAAMKNLRKVAGQLSYDDHWGIILGIHSGRKILVGVFNSLKQATVSWSSQLEEGDEESETETSKVPSDVE